MTALQRLQGPAEMPGSLRLHTQSGNNVCFRNAITIGRDRGEAHSHDAVMLGDFGADIDPQRVRAVIEDNQDFVAVSELPDGPNHRRKTL